MNINGGRLSRAISCCVVLKAAKCETALPVPGLSDAGSIPTRAESVQA